MVMQLSVFEELKTIIVREEREVRFVDSLGIKFLMGFNISSFRDLCKHEIFCYICSGKAPHADV